MNDRLQLRIQLIDATHALIFGECQKLTCYQSSPPLSVAYFSNYIVGKQEPLFPVRKVRAGRVCFGAQVSLYVYCSGMAVGTDLMSTANHPGDY